MPRLASDSVLASWSEREIMADGKLPEDAMFTMRWILAFNFCLAVSSFATAQPAQPVVPHVPDADYYFSHGIIGLIEQLGSSSYAKRETAYKTLDSFGPMALKQLYRFRNFGNRSEERRVAELIRRAEDVQITQQILAPKEVSLQLKNARVNE